MIPYGRQDISPADIDAVVAVLRSDFLTQGPKVPEFEALLAEYCGARHALAVNSATSALHIACLSLGVGPGDVVWTSPITFVASANCALYCGARVDFVDIDPLTCNMSPAALERKLEAAQAQGQALPKVVIVVHMAGQSCAMQEIGALARRYGFAVIEDASHAIGARYRGAPVGGCQYADITVFSFHPVKIITTAEGGAVTTNRVELAERMALLRSHGVTRDPGLMTQAGPDEPWVYEQIELGYNYRMTELQAALGCSQMSRLDDFVARRHALYARYQTLLGDLPLILPLQPPEVYSSLHLCLVQLDDTVHISRAAVYAALREQGIGVNVHYIPVHTQPYFRALGFSAGQFPAAENYYARALSLPLFHQLSHAQQDQVVGALRAALS